MSSPMYKTPPNNVNKNVTEVPVHIILKRTY